MLAPIWESSEPQMWKKTHWYTKWDRERSQDMPGLSWSQEEPSQGLTRQTTKFRRRAISEDTESVCAYGTAKQPKKWVKTWNQPSLEWVQN